MFPSAKSSRAKGTVKAHILLDCDGALPLYVLITEASRNDVKIPDSFLLNQGSILAMDRGCHGYSLFGKWAAREIYLVTRLKVNAVFVVPGECAVLETCNIRSDQLV